MIYKYVYGRGRGFESPWGPKFFNFSIFNLFQLNHEYRYTINQQLAQPDTIRLYTCTRNIIHGNKDIFIIKGRSTKPLKYLKYLTIGKKS